MRQGIDLQISHINTGFPRSLRCHVIQQTLMDPDMCLHSRHQFCRAEWLDHIIICSQTKTADLVYIRLLGCHHNDRQVLFLPKFPADIKTADTREHHIQKDQVIIILLCQTQAIITVHGHLHFILAGFQIISLQFCDQPVILTHQYFLHFLLSLLFRSLCSRPVFLLLMAV